MRKVNVAISHKNSKKIKILLIFVKGFLIGYASMQKIRFDHTRLYQWENYMCHLSKQYPSLYNRKWIIFLRAFIHWILKQKLFMKKGESGCEVIRISIAYELLSIIIIFEKKKESKFLKWFASTKVKNVIWLNKNIRESFIE